MSVRRLSQSFLSTRGRGKSSTFIAGYGFGVDEMDLLQRVTVGAGGAATITFSSIPQTYQHLQLRATALTAGSNQAYWVQFNGDTAANYSMHFLYGDGASVISGSRLSDGGANVMYQPTTANKVFAGIVDILDYASTSKHKVVRTLYGFDSNGAGYIALNSGSWRSASAITQIRLIDLIGGASFSQHSVVSLYGVVG